MADMHIRLVREDEIELAPCEECGNTDVIVGKDAGCKTCAGWVSMVNMHNPGWEQEVRASRA